MKPADVADLVVTCAPELRGLYVVFSAQTAASLARADEYVALTARNMDCRLREFIPDWHGRGPAILLNDRRIREDAPKPGPDWPDPLRWEFGRAALHEGAHILEFGPPYYGGSDGGDKPYPPDLLDKMADFLSRPWDDVKPAKVPPWHQHQAPWLRLVCHLAYRARRLLDLYVSVAAVVGDYRFYGMGHPGRYAQALGDEPERCMGRPFHEIMRQAPPEEFTAVWLSDTQAAKED